MSSRLTEFSQGREIKILLPKQIEQKLPMLLAQVEAGNTTRNLLNEIRQSVYSLYRAKQISKNYT